MSDRTSDDARAEDRARQTALVRGARKIHDALSEAIEGLERALAAAASTRTQAWSERVASELRVVREEIDAHVRNVEEERGLLDEIARFEPRLATRASDLRREHVVMTAEAAALAERVPSAPDADFGALRRDAASLLAKLRAHRAAEADLVFEAFWSDLGAPD